jgi:hypothetical protein
MKCFWMDGLRGVTEGCNMSLLDWLGVGIEKPVEAVGKLYTTDKDRLAGEAVLEDVQQKPQLAQIENNRLLILGGRFFNSAWQPLIGWTAGACVLIYWVPQLVVADYIWATQCIRFQALIPFPIKPDEIYNLVWLLFGFGGYSLLKRKIL